MPRFVYKAKKDTAETVTGQISAQSQDEAIELISQQGLLPVSVEEKISLSQARSMKSGKVKFKDLYMFTRQLVSLLKAGLPLLRALVVIEEQTSNSYFRNVISQICRKIKNGSELSECLADYPKIFSPLYIAMVKAGEESGRLKEMLLNISSYQQSQDEISSKVRMAFVYPIVMLVVGTLTVVFTLVFVMPKITDLYEHLSQSLPLPTMIVINLSNVLRDYWIWILLGILLMIYFFRQWAKTKGGHQILSQLKLSLPVFGTFILKVELMRFCSTMSLLMKSGISVLRTIQISIPIVDNELIKKELVKCQEDLTMGGTFGESLKESPLIPSMMANLIAVGEESGSLNQSLDDITQSYENETNESVKIMTTLLEPLMILAVGGVVAFIVFAMLLPIFQVEVFS